MKITPFGNQILVEPVENKQLLGSSLCEYGKVIAIGQDVERVKVGDTIGYLVWGINHLEIDGKKHYFVLESSNFVLGTLDM